MTVEDELKKTRADLENQTWGLKKTKEAVKCLYDELQKAKDAAEEATHAKANFLACMSHEMRTPLNSIIGFSEIICSSDNEDEMRRQAGIILKEAEILLQIINDLLDNAKIEAGKMDLEIIPFHLESLITSVSHHANLVVRRKKLEWHVSVGEDVPRHLKGDSLRLRQIIINLVNNAFKFTQRGSVKLVIDLLASGDGGVKLRFMVKDTGIGIPEEKQKLIFESFSQADSSTTRKYGGTGLGTNIAKNLVELMGGEIGLDSQVGKGCTFWFSVCLGTCLESDINESLDSSDLAGSGEIPKSAGQLLVVEDYEPNQEVARKHLEGAGYTVRIVSDAKEALEACGQQSYDLILMDLQMPDMDGYEATRRIRNGTSENTRKPILALTADAYASTKKACLDCGMNDVITKPLRRDLFLRSVHRWIGQSDKVPHQIQESTAQGNVEKDAPSHPLLDYKKALELFDEDQAFLDYMIDKFLKTAKSQVTLIREALKNNDSEAVRREAHKIKSGAGNITAAQMSGAASRLEELVKSGRPEGFPEAVERVEEEFVRLEKFVGAGLAPACR